MLLGSVDAAGQMVPLEYHRRITRLGGGFCPQRGLSFAAMERTLSALCAFAGRLAEGDVDGVAAIGTAALRRAVNGPDFVSLVREKTGLTIEVVDGEEEARLAATGVLAALDPRPAHGLIFDIGGGSTEFILVVDGSIRFQRSYPLGVVTLCEDFPDPRGRQAEVDLHLDHLRRDLAAGGLLPLVEATDCGFIGTAGTVTSLAALQLEMIEYDWRRVNNLVLSREALGGWRGRLAALDVPGREALPGLEEGRGDLILPGLEIVLHLSPVSAARPRRSEISACWRGCRRGRPCLRRAAGELTFSSRSPILSTRFFSPFRVHPA